MLAAYDRDAADAKAELAREITRLRRRAPDVVRASAERHRDDAYVRATYLDAR